MVPLATSTRRNVIGNSLPAFLDTRPLIRETALKAPTRLTTPDELGLDCELTPFRPFAWQPANRNALPYFLALLAVARAFGTAHLFADGAPEPPRCSLIEEPRIEELMRAFIRFYSPVPRPSHTAAKPQESLPRPFIVKRRPSPSNHRIR